MVGDRADAEHDLECVVGIVEPDDGTRLAHDARQVRAVADGLELALDRKQGADAPHQRTQFGRAVLRHVDGVLLAIEAEDLDD